MGKTKSGAQAPAKPAQAGDEIDWAEVRRQIRERVFREADDIVAAAIGKAKTGYYPAMKYLFELAGLHPLEKEERGSDDFSLARLLCDRLGLPPAPDLPDCQETEVLNLPENTAGHGNGHALE